jgi:hypothetical protein
VLVTDDKGGARPVPHRPDRLLRHAGLQQYAAWYGFDEEAALIARAFRPAIAT